MSDQKKKAIAVAPTRRGWSRNTGLTLLLLGLTAMIVLGLFVSTRTSTSTEEAAPAPGPGADDTAVVRENSRRLSTANDGKVTFVEFLDFECEACGAAYPSIEQLREQYAGRVTFVVRYFPLEGHRNSRQAARAVEAAAQQGQFEAMYHKMFQTQADWGEQQVPQDALFRGYAAELGLDLAKWDADYNSPATEQRIQADVDDGTALGVDSTPTFFVNGQQLQPESFADLNTALDEALAQ